MNLFDKPRGAQTRWASFENPTAGRNCAGLENRGGKGHPCDHVAAGTTRTLLDVVGSGTIRRIWLTINDRSAEMLRSLRLDMFWDGASQPAVSCPLGDFFGIGLGRRTPFECALFSDPEGRSFNCFVPMPFRQSARVTLTNESDRDLPALFYEVNLDWNVKHTDDALYFHAHWRRESPNSLGREFFILPQVWGNGRFLGCNVGVITNAVYEDTWWGEGEVKVWMGDDEHATLCGTGTEDHVGTAWGQGTYAHRDQGCHVADREKGYWAFYRYHLDDPIYFDGGCRVAIQTIGGGLKKKIIELQSKDVPLIPVTISSLETEPLAPFCRLLDLLPSVDLTSPELPEGWCNFWRQDDWSSTAYFYLDLPSGVFPPLASVASRSDGLVDAGNTQARADA